MPETRTTVLPPADLTARRNARDARRADQARLWAAFGTIGFEAYELTVALAEEARSRMPRAS